MSEYSILGFVAHVHEKGEVMESWWFSNMCKEETFLPFDDVLYSECAEYVGDLATPFRVGEEPEDWDGSFVRLTRDMVHLEIDSFIGTANHSYWSGGLDCEATNLGYDDILDIDRFWNGLQRDAELADLPPGGWYREMVALVEERRKQHPDKKGFHFITLWDFESNFDSYTKEVDTWWYMVGEVTQKHLGDIARDIGKEE